MACSLDHPSYPLRCSSFGITRCVDIRGHPPSLHPPLCAPPSLPPSLSLLLFSTFSYSPTLLSFSSLSVSAYLIQIPCQRPSSLPSPSKTHHTLYPSAHSFTYIFTNPGPRKNGFTPDICYPCYSSPQAIRRQSPPTSSRSQVSSPIYRRGPIQEPPYRPCPTFLASLHGHACL